MTDTPFRCNFHGNLVNVKVESDPEATECYSSWGTRPDGSQKSRCLGHLTPSRPLCWPASVCLHLWIDVVSEALRSLEALEAFLQSRPRQLSGVSFPSCFCEQVDSFGLSLGFRAQQARQPTSLVFVSIEALLLL